jgi:hypothetical protein
VSDSELMQWCECIILVKDNKLDALFLGNIKNLIKGVNNMGGFE